MVIFWVNRDKESGRIETDMDNMYGYQGRRGEGWEELGDWD